MHPTPFLGFFALATGLALSAAGAEEAKSAVAFRALDLDAARAAAQAFG
jgi:hypothetical protein